MPNGKVSLLFVCMGNICRSPAAENVMRHALERESLSDQFELDSAGTIGFHAGRAPDPRMSEAARRRGFPTGGSARQVTRADLDLFDWILVMDRENLEDVEALARRHGPGRARIALFCDFCEKFSAREVPDPYYGGPEGFEKVLDLLEDGCEGLVRKYRAGEL